MKRKKLSERILPDYTRGEEIFNMASHAAGVALGIVATVLCVVAAARGHNSMGVVTGAIFGASMILLYTISSVYHGLSPRVLGKKVLRVLDHCTIYLLIAGSYTPLALCALRGVNPKMGWTLFGVVWGAAVIGIILTAIDMDRFKVFSMICYLAMGWCVVVTWKPMTQAIGLGGTVFLVLGGVSYTIGAMLYVIGKKKNKRYVHSIFHLFVVLGSLLHFFCVLFYVM